MNKNLHRDLSFLFIVLAYLFLEYAGILIYFEEPEEVIEVVDIPVVEEKIEYDSYEIAMDMKRHLDIFLKTCPVICMTEPTDLENYSCIMYATQPIGRYFVTAYNDEETNCKITASGGKVHEGTITTCAADPKYHKFGEVLEIDGRLYVVEDTGSAVKKRHIDIFFDDYKKMARYGSNYQTIYKVSFPFGKPK